MLGVSKCDRCIFAKVFLTRQQAMKRLSKRKRELLGPYSGIQYVDCSKYGVTRTKASQCGFYELNGRKYILDMAAWKWELEKEE